MAVVLPAPLGPNRPKISPYFTSNESMSTAFTSANVLLNFCTSRALPFADIGLSLPLAFLAIEG